MQRLVTALITCFFILLLSACSPVSDKEWTSLIHENSSFIIMPETDMKVSDIVTKEYASYLDDLTPSAIQQIATLDLEIPNSIDLKALVLSPATATKSHFLWIGEHPGSAIDDWAPQFYKPFSQNKYEFKGLTIHKLFFNKSDVFAAQVGKWLVVSESSIVLENALRTYTGELAGVQFESEPQPGTLVLNTPHFDKWIEQFATTQHRPSVMNSLKGTKPVSLTFEPSSDSLKNIQFSGRIGLEPENRSVITDAFSYENNPITLDRHIGSNAAAFAIFHLPPVSIPVDPGEKQSDTDSLLLSDLDFYQQMAASLGNEFAFVAFPESGLQTNGEFLFMRILKDRRALQSRLDSLVEQDLIYKIQNTYQINSTVISKLIGSELSVFGDFYLSFSGNVVVIAKRRGLAESVNSDRTRRRVIYYDETYSNVRNTLPSDMSGFVWSSSGELMKFISPYLKSDNVATSLINRFDITSITMTAEENAVNLSVNTYAKEGSTLPYEELWVLPLSDFDLSGEPVLGDLVGSSTNEIVFSTTDGRVVILASDGTISAQTSTNGIEPMGGPVLYDWYGNGQPVILLAAGSQIFAWNSSGNLLPKFPLEIGQKISAPILVTDVLRNGVPEIVVATEDRKVHVLDGRGENVRGWPQNTNSTVTAKPVFELLEGRWSIWAFSQNTLHSWLRNGTTRPEYPQFINAPFTGSPVFYKDQVLGSAADGYLYSIGTAPLFNDSVATNISESEISVRSLYVAGSELSAVSIQENVLLKGDENFYREDLITTQSANGSIFLYNPQGELRFTQSLGQPASHTLVPFLTDINSDQKQELLALAEFGRLYAWEILTNQRLFGIPTSGIKYPIITDLNGDGQKELIAQTREGLRCWTIMKSRN
ncbi:MAG: hypothetical protein WD597_09570 [Balneolaceae bacterium]